MWGWLDLSRAWRLRLVWGGGWLSLEGLGGERGLKTQGRRFWDFDEASWGEGWGGVGCSKLEEPCGCDRSGLKKSLGLECRIGNILITSLWMISISWV